MSLAPPPISADFIASVGQAVRANECLRRKLPAWGRVHIDRQVPFLCLYRRPPEQVDVGTERLCLGEAAYLLVDGSPNLSRGVAALCREIIACQSSAFGASLLMELWSKDAPLEVPAPPAFGIVAPPIGAPSLLLESLESSLLTVSVNGAVADVRLDYASAPSPHGLEPLFSEEECRELGCLYLGLEVRPIYRDPVTGDLFPAELKALHRAVGQALKRCFFEFARAYTKHRPAHYLELGRHAMTRAVWETDRHLAELGSGFDILLHVTPINAPAAWTRFRAGHFQQEPEFLYRPRPFDPGLLKRRLFSIPIERIEDPSLAHLFEEKRDDLDRRISLVADRGTPRFLLGSRQLYGDVEPALLAAAIHLLEQSDSQREHELRNSTLDANCFAERARRELDYYREQDAGLEATVSVRDDIPGIMVSQGQFLIGRGTRIRESRIDAVLAHEIGIHVLTHHNGRQQPFKEFSVGLAGYDELQEGLAVLSEHLVGQLDGQRLRLLGARVLAVHMIADGAEFVETFSELHKDYGFSASAAFDLTMRVFRGGGYTKDVVYLRGLMELMDYLAAGKQLASLFLGKIALRHAPLVEELRWRQVLKPPRLWPRFIDYPDCKKRIARLTTGCSVVDLAKDLS